MRISYQIICDFWSQNKKILIIWQTFFLLFAGLYLVIAPKKYEAYFHVRTAKILVNDKWSALKWARYTRRDLMSPQSLKAELVQSCMGGDGNAIRRSLVNAIQIDVIDDSGGTLGIAVRLTGIDRARECANLLANSIVETSGEALAKRLAEDGFAVANSQKGKINNYEKPMITSQVQMSDTYASPKPFHLLLATSLLALISSVSFVILRKRYRVE
jgi:hypothetical protein